MYRQKSGDTVLRKVGDVGKDGNSLIDHLICNNEEYKWVVIPVTEEELGISMESAPVLTDWHSWSISALSQVSPRVYFPQETWFFSIDLSESELSQNVDKTIFKTNSTTVQDFCKIPVTFLIEELNSEDVEMTTTTQVINLVKQDGKWIITTTNDELVNSLLPGLKEAIDSLS